MGVLLFVTLGLGLTLRALTRGPNTVLTFDRAVHTDEAQVELAYRLSHFSEWPHWFYSLGGARSLDGSPTVAQGQTIELAIDPKKGPSRRFTIIGKVTQFEPGKRLMIQVVSETSGKISRLFENIEWEIELTPSEVRGHETAETKSARARLLGRLAPRILLNQIFYPDVIALAAEFKPPPLDLMGP